MFELWCSPSTLPTWEFMPLAMAGITYCVHSSRQDNKPRGSIEREFRNIWSKKSIPKMRLQTKIIPSYWRQKFKLVALQVFSIDRFHFHNFHNLKIAQHTSNFGASTYNTRHLCAESSQRAESSRSDTLYFSE